MNWCEDEARALRANGLSWRVVGEHFGITEFQARSRLDQEFLQKRRDELRKRRAPEQKSETKNSHMVIRRVSRRRFVVEEKTNDDQPKPMTYRKFVPNSGKIGVALSTNGEGYYITLPWVSLLAKPLEKLRPTHEQA